MVETAVAGVGGIAVVTLRTVTLRTVTLRTKISPTLVSCYADGSRYDSAVITLQCAVASGRTKTSPVLVALFSV